jgi:hypothetical protein
MNIDLALWVAVMLGSPYSRLDIDARPAAPVIFEGNKAAPRAVLLPSDTEIAERQHADGFFAQPSECA